LKTLWSDRLAYFETEAKWRAMSSKPDELEAKVVEVVFDQFLGGAAMLNCTSPKRGTVTVLDHEQVGDAIGVDFQSILNGQERIIDTEGGHYRWDVALDIARRAVAHDPRRVMAFVHAAEAGRVRLRSWSKKSRKPEVIERLRQWCDQSVMAVEDEIRDAGRRQDELTRILVEALAFLSVTDPRKSLELYQRFSPGTSQRDWRIFMALELGGRCPAAQPHLWRVEDE
jgi:hypothetical protein